MLSWATHQPANGLDHCEWYPEDICPKYFAFWRRGYEHSNYRHRHRNNAQMGALPKKFSVLNHFQKHESELSDGADKRNPKL